MVDWLRFTMPESIRLHRTATIEKAADKAVDSVCFASEETPVEREDKTRGKYFEHLDCSPGGADLSALQNGGAFLFDHNEKRSAGEVVAGTAKLCEDRKARAEVKWYPEFELIRGEILDGKRPNSFSVGYDQAEESRRETRADGLHIWFRWKPVEVSCLLTMEPADEKAGLYRSKVDSHQKPNAEEREKFMAENTTATLEVKENEIRADERAKTKTATLDAERKRTKDINAIADTLIKDHGKKNGGQMEGQIRSMVSQALAGDESVESFQLRCMQDVLKAKPAEPTLIEHCSDEEGQRNYSILRGIQSCIKRDSHIPDGLEGEVHQEALRRAKANGGAEETIDKGFMVPANAPMRVRSANIGGRLKRDMTAGVFAQGGAFVPTIMRLPIIELLRNLEILEKVGMQTIAGLTGNIVIPRQEAAATAYALAETDAVQASNQVLGQIAMSPHRVGVQQVYSRLFLIQSAPDAEEFLRMDMLTVMALLWDKLGLTGQGAANEPLGLMNVPGSAAELFGATPTYAKIVDMETQVRSANVRGANAGPCAYISTPKTRGKLKITPATLTGSTVVSGSSNALWVGGGNEDSGEMNGYPAWDTNQVPADRIIFGAFRQLIRAIWGGLSVIVDPYTKASQDEYVVTMNSYGDFAVRHPQAFCISADSGAQ